MAVECTCGAIWCFQCKKAAHWPASCEQAERYAELRKDGKV